MLNESAYSIPFSKYFNSGQINELPAYAIQKNYLNVTESFLKMKSINSNQRQRATKLLEIVELQHRFLQVHQMNNNRLYQELLIQKMVLDLEVHPPPLPGG